ncbi:S1/P1 nuclease [Cladorrhinum samala]|uniref:S1/P1 nuclease n=1 Tax=Cladorrhinum samala TaxID=585594 RepID=A0AAV9HYG5_9PEZI|nr:S1/P1 nuclease [Cladorrhinum samala]
MLSRTIPFFLAIISPAACWDPLGHQTVGFLAQKYFTTQANETISSLIGLNSEFDIGDAAAWADTVRDKDGLPWSKNWHFINPKGDDPATNTCKLSYPSDCPGANNDNCIISQILNQTSIVLNFSLPLPERRQSTMFLLHFFGDLHQPMHTSGYKYGGNLVRPVCWGRQPPCTEYINDTVPYERNLHATWDSAIPRKLRGLEPRTGVEETKRAAIAWAEDLWRDERDARGSRDQDADQDFEVDVYGARTIIGYAEESNRLVCSSALSKGVEWVLSNDLSLGYYEENKEVVKAQVTKAGRRLAGWMNVLAAELGRMQGMEKESKGNNNNNNKWGDL